MCQTSGRKFVPVLALYMMLCAAASPQENKPPQPQPTAPAATGAAGPATVVLKEGTEVRLRFAQRLSTETAVVGDPVELTLDQDLMADNAVVARKGARVLGEVVEGKESEKKRRGSKAVSISIHYLRTGNDKIPLRGEYGAKAKVNKGAAVAATAMFGPTGLFVVMGNKHFEIPEGTRLTAYVAQDVQLAPLTPDK